LSGVPFDAMDFSLLQSLASQVGLAIQNSTTIQLQIEKNKIDLDLQLAQNIQNLLLPSQFPEDIPLEFATHYLPAQKIGGDLYDVFEIDTDSIGVAIADVSGKGIPASIVMAMCQTHLKHLIKQKTSPADILKLLNEELLKTMRPGMFVTLSLGIINLKTNSLTIARAGHEAPLFYSPNHKERIFPIEVSGMALGIVPGEIFNEKIEDFTLSFQKDDILVLYTDGVTEMENKKQVEFSADRLMRIIDKTSSKNADAIVADIIERLNDFAEGLEPLDDQTLLLIKHIGKPN
jgi:sigma-B regulation protein RsbU (phosphoserine phosphatase)